MELMKKASIMIPTDTMIAEAATKIEGEKFAATEAERKKEFVEDVKERERLFDGKTIFENWRRYE